MLARMPSPVFSTLDNVTKGTPCFLACSSGFAMTERVTALRITASAPWRSAVWNAFCSCSGEPSVPIVEAVQPRSEAPCLMMSPWISQASTPQLMKATFLPLGTGLPIGVVSPMLVGRAGATTALSGGVAARPVAASARRDHCDDDREDRGEREERRGLACAVPLRGLAWHSLLLD